MKTGRGNEQNKKSQVHLSRTYDLTATKTFVPAYEISGGFILPRWISLDNPHHVMKGMVSMLICRKFITRKDGTRLYASQLGLEAICFEVTNEQHQAYLEKKKKEKAKAKQG